MLQIFLSPVLTSFSVFNIFIVWWCFGIVIYLLNIISSNLSFNNPQPLWKALLDDVLARQDMHDKNRESNRSLSNSAARFRSPARQLRATGKRNPALFKPGERPAKKCNGRLEPQRGNLHRSARHVNGFPFNFYRESRIPVKRSNETAIVTDRRKPHDLENLHKEKETSANALECVACRCKTHFTGTTGERCTIESIAFVSEEVQACHWAAYFFSRYFLSRITVVKIFSTSCQRGSFNKIDF